MIQGYRTIYDAGALVSPPAPAASTLGTRSADDPAQSGPLSPSAPLKVRQGLVATTQRPVNETGASDPAAVRASPPGSAEPAESGTAKPTTDQEATLPQLSAEALTTALLSAEPDKALVPRVLPANLADDPL